MHCDSITILKTPRMIDQKMFFSNRTIMEYRDMVLDDILKEYLLFKGTWDADDNAINKEVQIKDIVRSGLFVYGLKDNATNKSAVSYYCEREAQRRLIIHDGLITVPEKLWKECDEYNRAHCVKKAFDLDCDDYEHGTPEGGCDGMGHYLCNECKWRSQESLRRIHEDELHGKTIRKRSRTNQYIRARVIESDEEVLVDDFDIDGIYNMWHSTESGIIYHDDELEFLDPRLQSIPNK